MKKVLYETLLTPSQAAKILKVSQEKLKRWRESRKPPQFYLLNQTVVRYAMFDLIEFLNESKVVPVQSFMVEWMNDH